jgi:uncharacterized delta-60 repeat protein
MSAEFPWKKKANTFVVVSSQIEIGLWNHDVSRILVIGGSQVSHVKMKFALLPAFLIFLLAYQNCSRIQLSAVGAQDQHKAEMDSGNGGVYEGKPGTYYRHVPGSTCEGSPALYSAIDIAGPMSSILFNYASKCNVIKGPVSTESLNINSLNGLVIGYRDGIYERSEMPLGPQNPPQNPVEAFCQSLSPQSDFTEVVVRTSSQASESRAELFVKPSASGLKNYSFSALSRSVGLPKIRYSNKEFDLAIRTDQNVPNQLHIFASQLSFQVGGSAQTLSLACRTGSVLDPSLIQPVPGTLSQNFGINGKVTIPNPLLGGNAKRLLQLKSQKMLIAVSKYGDSSFNLLRLNADGSVDATFGTAGWAKLSMGAASAINSVYELADQRLLVAGESGGDGAILRLNKDGSLDTSFGSNGKAIQDFGGPSDSFNDLQLQPDGKITAVGAWGNNSVGVFLAVARFSSNGILDTAFGQGGIEKLNYAAGDNVRVTSTGQILLATDINSLGAKKGFGLVALRSDGSTDKGFGLLTPGISGFDFGVSDQTLSIMKVQSDGKLLMAGRVNSDYGLVRLLENGQVDPSFAGGNGVVTDGFLSDYLNDVVLQPDGKMVIIGGHSGAGPRIVRLDDDGQRDYSFNNGQGVNPNSSPDFVSLPTDALEPQSGFFTVDGRLRFVVSLQHGSIAVYELNL